MNRVTGIIVLGVMVLLMVGCGGSRYSQALLVADSLMADRPDSALAVLEGVEGQMAGESRPVRMRYQLLRHKAMNKAYVPFTSDSLMLDVTDYYDSHGTANERMEAHYLLGCVYRDMREAPKALSAYHDAVECADTTAVDCDFSLLSRVHGQMTILLERMQLPYEALEETNAASHFAYLGKDTLMGISGYGYRSALYYLIGNLDSVIQISLRSSDAFLYHGDTLYSIMYIQPAIVAYIEKNNIPQAKILIDKYEKALQSYSDQGVVRSVSNRDNAMKFSYYLAQNKLDSAKYYFDLTDTVYDKKQVLNLYRQLAKYYIKVGKTDSAYIYTDRYVKKDDSLYRTSVRENFQKVHALYNYEHSKRQAELKESELRKTKFVGIVIFLVIILIFLVVVIVENRKRSKMRAHLNALNISYSNHLEQYSNARKQLQQLHHALETNKMALASLQLVDNSNKALITRLVKEIEDKTSEIDKTQEELERLRHCLTEFQEDKQEPGKWNLSEDILSQSIVLRLHEIIKTGQQPSYNDFDEVRKMIDAFYPNFITKLKELYPNISSENLLFCIFIKLRFIPSELAIIFGLKPQSVSNRRNSLNKIMFTGRGGAKDFDYRIRKLS